MAPVFRILLTVGVVTVAAGVAFVPRAADAAPRAAESRLFVDPQRVAILGYEGDAMEPFLTRDGRYLLFNNLNVPPVDTNLHFAERVDDLTFRYRGELQGVNTTALEGVASVDERGTIYFVSPRSYEATFSTLYRGSFLDGKVSNVELVPGVSRQEPGIVNFDVEVSRDGESLYFVDARFGRRGPESADLVLAERRDQAFARRSDSAEILENVNTKALEYAPCISADGLTLLFTRGRLSFGGKASIFLARRTRAGEPFGPAERLAALDGLVEAPTFSPDERFVYYHKREGARFVLYRAGR